MGQGRGVELHDTTDRGAADVSTPRSEVHDARPLAALVLAALLTLAFAAPPPARADGCDDLADSLGNVQKGGEFLALYFRDCKELDAQKLKDLEDPVDKHQLR